MVERQPPSAEIVTIPSEGDVCSLPPLASFFPVLPPDRFLGSADSPDR
jgi:hypothetical protein